MRRIGHDQVERSAERGSHVAGDERRRHHAEPPRVRARHHERARARVGSDSERARQFAHEREKERTAPGTEIGDPAQTRAWALGIDGGERRLDDRFALRPRHQRRLGERKLQAPEFLAAHDARDRFASEAPARKGIDRVARLALEHARASRRERRLVEAKRMTDKNTRIEFG
jgi:hypothetical protein